MYKLLLLLHCVVASNAIPLLLSELLNYSFNDTYYSGSYDWSKYPGFYYEDESFYKALQQQKLNTEKYSNGLPSTKLEKLEEFFFPEKDQVNTRMKRSAKEEKINGIKHFAIKKNTEIKNKNMHGNFTAELKSTLGEANKAIENTTSIKTNDKIKKIRNITTTISTTTTSNYDFFEHEPYLRLSATTDRLKPLKTRRDCIIRYGRKNGKKLCRKLFPKKRKWNLIVNGIKCSEWYRVMDMTKSYAQNKRPCKSQRQDWRRDKEMKQWKLYCTKNGRDVIKTCWKSICVDVHKNGKPTIPWEDTKAGYPSN